MRSPGSVRAGFEWLLRAAVIALLAWYLFFVLRSRTQGAAEGATSAELRTALVRWSTIARPARVHTTLDHPPAGSERDWLAALSATGTRVEWSGPSLLPTAVAVAPRADPAGGADVSVAAPAGSTVMLRDTLGVLDSARAAASGVRAYIPKPRPTIDAVVGPVSARAARHDSLDLKRLLVSGQAGWETKFVVAALEERGWDVDAHFVVSPKSDVRQGEIAAIDTARYSAVLAVDTAAARYADRIARYVRSGGGLVLWTPAASAFASVAPGGGVGIVIEDEGRAPTDSAPRLELELVPITRLAEDAIVLERRGSDVSLAARRVGPGRVIQTGYTNAWRWRMAGGDEAPESHRTWLAGLVARVAYTGRTTISAAPTDVAPLASLIDRLGPAVATGAGGAGLDPNEMLRRVFGLLCGAMVLEWASRRVRGVK
jgi:hypothetical protein